MMLGFHSHLGVSQPTYLWGAGQLFVGNRVTAIARLLTAVTVDIDLANTALLSVPQAG